MKITTLEELINSSDFFKRDWKLESGAEITALPYASEVEGATAARVHFNVKLGPHSLMPAVEILPLSTPVFA